MFSKLFYYVAQVLNVPLPEVFLVEDNKAADIQLANAIEKTELCPSFVVRPHLLQGKNEREIAFLSARRLTFMRPEYYLKMLLPTNTELKVVVLSAIAMVQPRFPVPPDMVQLVQQYLPEMQKRMPPHAIEQLGAGRPAVHPGGAGDQPREVGPRGRCGLAPRGLRGVRRSRGRGAHGLGGAGHRRWSAGEGQDQGARALLDQRGVLHGPRPDGPDDRGLRPRVRTVLGLGATSPGPFDFEPA